MTETLRNFKVQRRQILQYGKNYKKLKFAAENEPTNRTLHFRKKVENLQSEEPKYDGIVKQ